MSGWPTRISRDSFGPEKENSSPVLNPKQHVSDDELNLLFWQVAGAGVTQPLAWVRVTGTGSRLRAGAVWNPNGDPSLHPQVQKTGTGLYTVTWAAQYPNRKGVPTQVVLNDCIAFVQGIGNVVASGGVSGTVLTVRTAEMPADAVSDAPFFAAVW